MFSKKKKSPWLAALLSLFFPGLGQAYAGKYDRGMIMAAVTLGIMFCAFLLVVTVGDFMPHPPASAPWRIRNMPYKFIWLWSFSLFVYLWMVYDAWRSCRK